MYNSGEIKFILYCIVFDVNMDKKKTSFGPYGRPDYVISIEFTLNINKYFIISSIIIKDCHLLEHHSIQCILFIL